MQMKQHPLSAAFPSMPDSEMDSLVEDIKKHGLREPVIVFDGMVLDGWHRYRACEAAGKKCVTQKFEGGDPVAFVLSRNLHRRHLTGSQRASAVVSATNWRPLGDQSRSVPGTDRTTAEMAKEAEVSASTIEHAKAAHQAGLGDAVREGVVSAKAAAEVAKLSPKKREKAVEAIERGEKPQGTKPEKKKDFEALYTKAVEERDEAREGLVEITQTARELEDRLSALECKDPDEQQKEILRLKQHAAKLEAEISRLTRARNDCQTKCNELIRQVKSLERKK